MSFVCEENFGSRTLTETTAVRPSRQSSPERPVSFNALVSPPWSAYFWSARVRAVLKPSRCVPPSLLLIVLVKVKIVSAYPSFHWSATSTRSLSVSRLGSPVEPLMSWKKMTLSWMGCLVLFRCSTKERIPPS